MMPLTRRMPAYFAPLVVILAFVAFLTFSLVRLFQVEQDMRSNVSDNMLWVITQAQVASHRLDEAVNRRALGDETTRPDLRFDVLTSRLVLLDAGPQQRYLAGLGFDGHLATAFEQLDAIEPLLERVQPGAIDVADRIHGTLEPMMRQLNRIANAVMIEEWETTGARLDEHRNSTLQVIASVVGIMLSGVVLVVLLLSALRQRANAQRALARHRNELEDEVERRTRDLDAERQRLAAAIETAPDGFAAFDTRGRLALTNPQLAELLPISATSLARGRPLGSILQDIRELARPEETQCDTLGTALNGSLQCDMEILGQGWRQMMIRQTDDGGHVLRVADITRYKKAALSLESALRRERGVSDFYRSFAATVSHQFRTPLAVIDSGLQRLLRRGDQMTPEDRQQRYTRLRDAVSHMTRLVESALTAARLDGGQVEASTAPCDLAAIAQQVCKLQEETAGTRRITLELAGSPPLLVVCDRALVEQILANLVSNALKYSAPDAPITVRLDHDSAHATCTVQDRGIGIPEEDLPLLFERFFRSRNVAAIPGIGLGLNIARHLARFQHGDITVASREGEGTRFTLTLPLAAGGAEP
jgi:signal transduction histidine kinase